MTELFNYFLINPLLSFLLKIHTCKPLKFLCSHLTNVGEKVLLGIRLAYKLIYEQNQYPCTCVANWYITTQINKMCRTTLFNNISIIRIKLLLNSILWRQFLHRAFRKKSSHRLQIQNQFFRKSSGVLIATMTLHSSLFIL